jgi:hypothetical protein
MMKFRLVLLFLVTSYCHVYDLYPWGHIPYIQTDPKLSLLYKIMENHRVTLCYGTVDPLVSDMEMKRILSKWLDATDLTIDNVKIVQQGIVCMSNIQEYDLYIGVNQPASAMPSTFYTNPKVFDRNSLTEMIAKNCSSINNAFGWSL